MDINNSRQDQFFNDSPIESSLNSIFGAITTENTSSTYLKSSPPSTTSFPVHAFNTLNSLLSRSHWQVPVLPDSQLETILLASINMAKHGEDIYSQDCLRFYSDGLISSFQKIFHDDAVTRWDSHILHFIYANALLAIELCSIKAKSDCLGILELESILFNPNSRFHTRSMISTGVTHEIRYGVHRNVVFRFEDIIKLLPHISISNVKKIDCHHQQQEEEQLEEGEKTSLVQESDVLRQCDTVLTKEYSIPYDDYKDAPILVDFINLFGRFNGFERLKSRFIELDSTYSCNQKEQQKQQDGMQHQQSQETSDKADFLSLNLIHAYLHPFALCSNYLSDSVIEDYFKPIITIVIDYLSHLTDDQIKLEAKKETRKDDLITGLYFSLCTLLKRIPLTNEDDAEKIELLCLNMIYRFFQSSSFNGKMNTLNELIRLLPNVNSLRVGQWIADIKLLKLLLRENLHQLQYVEKVEEIIRFMIRKLLLTSNDLDIIWESQIGKHETIIKNIFNMLTRLSLEFSMNQLNYLFNCFKRSWDKATKRQRERLIDLITMLAEQDTDGMMMQKTLDLLWGWAVSLKFSTDLMNASLKAHTKILSCNKSFVCQLRSTWLGKLASFLKIGPNEECLLPAAKQFIEIANLYNTGSLNENTLIQNINQQYNVLKATVDCIIQTMWSVHEERLNELMKIDSTSKSSFPIKHTKTLNSNHQLIKVQELLKLLRYLIFQCRLLCTIDLLQQIWDSMLKATFKPNFIVYNQSVVLKCLHQIVLPDDCDLSFRWFTLFFNDPIWLEYRYFIWDNYTVLNPKLMTNAGIKFVIQLFHRINSDNTFIINEFNTPNTIKLLTTTSPLLSSTLVNSTITTTIPTVAINSSMYTTNIKLVNLKQLWNFILYSKKSVYNKTCKLLRHLYTNHISNSDMNKRKDLYIDIMHLCYTHIKADYDKLISSIEKQTNCEVTFPSKLSLSCNPEIESSVFQRILRILKLLKQFTTRLDVEMSVNDIDHCIPLKRSWIGSSFFLTVICHTMPFLFHTSSNDNNEDIVENNKQIDYLDDNKTTITLLVHGNVTVGELRAYLYDFCINGFTTNITHVSASTTMNNNNNNNSAVSNSNGNGSSTGNASGSSSSSGIHCQDSNNILHSMTNSLYQLELSIRNKRQTNSDFLLSHNNDRELLVNLLIFLPNWTKKFLDSRDQMNNDAPFIHLELSAKLVCGYISNNYELSTSLTESSTTAPASSLLSPYYLRGFDATEALTTQQRTNDITLDPLCVTARTISNNTSNDSNIEEGKSDHEMTSELTIIDSIIDRNLEQEQLANNSNNDNKVGTLFTENKSNIDNSNPLGFTHQSDRDPNREFILNSDQRIEFLLNLSRIALTLNHPNVYHSVMDLLNCMPLHKKLTKFIEDSLIQLVIDKKTNGWDEPPTEPLLSQTWFDDLLRKPSVSIGIFNTFSKHVNLENTPNFIELLYTLQVLYCLMMPSRIVKLSHLSLYPHEHHNHIITPTTTHNNSNNSKSNDMRKHQIFCHTTTTTNNCNTATTATDFSTNVLSNQIPDWSTSINITLLLLRGGALNLLLSSPYLISSFPLVPLHSPSLNSQNANCDKNNEQLPESYNQLYSSSPPSTNATTTNATLSPPCFVTPFAINNNDNNAQTIVYDITIHWKLLCQIRLWLLRIIHVLLMTTANALVLHKLNITPDVFKKSSFYKLLTTSLSLSVKNPNSLSDALHSPLLSHQLSSVTSTTKTINVDGVEEDVGVDQNIECICKLLLHTYKLTTCSTHPVLGGNYFLLLNAIRVAQMTTESSVPLSEIENCWLKCNYSTFTNLCLTGWQTRYGCENLMRYYKDFSVKYDRIMKLSSWRTEMNDMQEDNLLKNKSLSENVLSLNSSSEFLLAENKIKADAYEIIQPIDHSNPVFDNNLSSSTHLCLSVLSLLSCESELSSPVSHSSSSSRLSPTHQLHSFSSSSSYSSNNDNIGGAGRKNTKNKSRSNASTSTSSSSNSTRNYNKANCKGLSKLSFYDFHKQCFHSFRSGNTQGSVIIEALNCISWYHCLSPQCDFHTFLNSPLSYRMLIGNLSQIYSVPDHRSRRIRRTNSHHKHSYKYFCYQSVLHPHCPPLQSHSYNYNYRITGADFLQDLLFSDSLIIRLSTGHCVLMLLTLDPHNNRNNIYYALEQLFNWLPDYVPSTISQSDEYFNLLVQLIPFMRCHEHFLQSARHWLAEEVVWLRAMVIDRQMGSYEASVSNSFIDDVLHCPTTPESIIQDSLVSSPNKEWVTFATCRPDTIIHQFHDIPIEEKDLLICGHLRVCVAMYQCFIDSSSSLLQLLTEDEIKEINDLPEGSVHLNNNDHYHITCVDTNLRTVNTNALLYNSLSSYSTNELYLVKDILEFILFPASKRYNEIRESKVSSQVTNQHHIMNSKLENNNSGNSNSKSLASHFSTSSDLSCSRKLMKCSFDFLLSLTNFNPLVNQLLTSMLYDLVFCANARPENFNWDYNFGINSTNSPSSLPSSLLFSDNDKNHWTSHHQLHLGDYDRNDNDTNTKAHHFVGLKNGGATCYMNSIIQQLFTLDPIRDCVLSANPEFLLSSSECNETNKVMNTSSKTTYSDDVEPNFVLSSCTTTQSNISHEPGSNLLSKEKIHHLNVLYHMQTIFGHLAYSRIKYYAPVEFWRHFKFRAEAVHVRDQHDALEFFQILGNDLDEALDLCKLPKIVEVVLGGKFADQKICLDCPHRYTSYESFTTLNVDILDHRNLLDSLEQYVKGELLEGENAYHCRMCNRKIPILKRMCIQKLPLVLTIQLKRFDYDWEQGVSLKFNNYCEFPRHLDMLPYTAQGLKDSLDSSFSGIVDGINSNNDDVDNVVANDNDGTFVSAPDNQACTDGMKQVINIINSDEQIDDTNSCTKYNLRGVVVHSGQASSGHYYSFIRHYRPKTKTYKWYKYDDHNVIPVRLDKDKEAVDQWFGGEWKASQHDMPKFSHLRSGKRWWSAYLLFYEREDFSEQIKKIPIPKLGSTSKQSRLTKRVQDIVDWQNIEHLHYRIQFNPLLPEFIYQLINKNIQLCMTDPTSYQNLAFITLELLLHFTFLRYRVVVSNWKCWLLLFIKLMSINAQIRCELIKSMFLTSPDQIKFLQFDCPYPEIRFLSASVIIYVSHLCMKDPSVQCDDILQSFILLVNNHTASNVTANNNDKSSDSMCNTVTTSTNLTNTAIPSSNIESITNNSTATSTTATVLSYLLKSTLNKTKSPVFVDTSIKDNTQIASRIFSATCFINRLLKLPQKISSCSLQSDSIVNCTLSNQLINPGECLIQLIIHQLHFSPNTLLSTSSSNKSFQQHHHQPYSTMRPGNPSSSFSMSSAALTSTPQSMMTVPSSSSSTLYPSSAYNNRSTSLLSSSSLSTMCPSSVMWAQYFAILLDYANCGERECCHLLKLHVPEIVLNYVLSYEPMLTTAGTSTETAPSIPYTLSSSCNDESRNPEYILMSIERLYNELSMEIQTTGYPNLRLSSSLDALIYALLTTSTESNSDFNFYTLYEYSFNGSLNNEQNNVTTIGNNDINITLPSLIMYSGLKISLDLLSYLIRSCEVPSHYLNFSSSSAFNCLFSSSSLYFSSATSTANCYSSTKPNDQISCRINESEKRSESNTTHSVVSESLLTDAGSKHASTNQHNPYRASSNPLIILSNSLIQLFFSNQSERILKRLTGSLLNQLTLQPISDILLFFSYENVNFSDLILRELICAILHPCDLDSILKLLERLLQISDSLKSVRIRLLFTHSNDSELFKLLNSNFIYETNAAAYQVFYLFLNLLLTDSDAVAYLSSDIYLVNVLSEVSASALNSLKLDTSDNWLDDKEKTIGVLEQAQQILFTLIPSIVTVSKNVIVNDSVQNEDVHNTENQNIKNTGNIRKQVDNLIRKSGVKSEDDVDDNDNDNDVDDDDDDYYDDDDDEQEQEEDEELDNGNDHLITSLCHITSSSLSTSDDPELDLPINNEYMSINHNKNCLTRDSTNTIIAANLIDNNNIIGMNFNSTCITAGPPATNTYTTITTASSSNSNNYSNDNYNNNSKQQILYGSLFSYGEFTGNVIAQQEEEEQNNPDNCNTINNDNN
ncbi:hypothetical protein MN116_002461 [Schistosoma mekongi]|uniref:USP domain-containing protein n=1 Tax=Schistosoma mekongi TaxID=38744 RepID=A0AAE1ZLD1_SCHME|nr:hypothetical protein MN116_002461 [Schistosoma mekongi]